MIRGPRELVREEVLAMKAYPVSDARGLIKLDAMENPFRLPEALAREMGERLASVAVNRYPDPAAPQLRARLREAMGIPEDAALMLGNGSDEVIQILTLALARPGAAVLAPEPSFVMYRLIAAAAGLRYVGVPLRPDLTLDEAAMLSAIGEHDPALVWLAYPNNPTGNLFPRDAVLRIVEAASGVVAIDEAYYAFSGGATFMGELGRHRNLLMVRTVSKLGLAGLRLGLAAGPREWIDQLEKMRPPYNVNALTAAAADLLLAHRDVFAAQTATLVAERSRLEAGLDRLGIRRFPSAANFVLVRMRDAPAAFEALKSRGILVRNFHGSHALLAHCLRLTVGAPDENARLLEALASIPGPHHA